METASTAAPTKTKFRWHWSYLLWLLVPVAVWLVLRGIPLQDTIFALARLQFWQLAVLIGMNVLALVAFTGAWWVILKAHGYALNYVKLMQGRVGGFGVSYFIPGPQMGSETVQVIWAVKRFGVPLPVATASVALDKTLEILVNFVIVATGLLVMAQYSVLPQVPPILLILVGLVLLTLPVAFLIAVIIGWKPITRLLNRAPHRLARTTLFQRTAQTVLETEQLMTEFCRQHRGSFGLALGLMALSWGILLADYWLGAYFLGMALTPLHVFMAIAMSRLALLVPLPGAAGALEGSQVLALSALGFSPALGLAQSLIMRIRDVSIALFGLIWMTAGDWLGRRLRPTTPP